MLAEAKHGPEQEILISQGGGCGSAFTEYAPNKKTLKTTMKKILFLREVNEERE